ncbi:hypothetical protein TNCV_335251 [Trichonephila clavipes]|nr:hypothetical protein TNCV_335251 [Trichonephila clavipes]
MVDLRPSPHLENFLSALLPNVVGVMRTATAGSDVVQSGRPILDDFFQHLWPYIGNNTANVVFQMVKRLWLICIDQLLYIAPQKIHCWTIAKDGSQITM